jgi:hypothetical protein
MNATATTSSSYPTAAERFEEIAPVIAARRVAGPSVALIVGPWLILVGLLIPPVALLFTLVAVVALPFLAVGLVVAVVASPYLIGRAVYRRVEARHDARERSVHVAGRLAHEGVSR